MNDKWKNIISNIIGLTIVVASVVGFFMERIEWKPFLILLGVGMVFFLFKATVTKGWISKYISKKLDK
jgi:hypothetical protein